MNNPSLNKTLKILKALFDNLPYEIHVWSLVHDNDGQIKTWRLADANTKALQSWGYALPDILGKTTDEIFPNSNGTALFMPVVRRIFETNSPYEWEERFADTGQVLRMVSIPLDDVFISCGMDVSEYRHIESELVQKTTELERSLKRLRAATRAATIGVWDYDIKNKSLFWDESMYEIYGVEPSTPQIPYESWTSGIHPDDVKRASQELSAAIKLKTPFHSEFRIVRKDNGETRHIIAQAASDTGPDGTPLRMIGVNYDVTERKKAEEQIERLAYFDTLTGLANRTLIEDRLAQAIGISSRTKNHCALIFIDLDGFKAINDSAGHAVGDEVLVTIAQRLVPLVRAGDTVGRFGGDEFIVILTNLSADPLSAAKAAETFAEKIAAQIHEPITLTTGTHVTTVSIGISLFAGPGVSSSEVLRHADLAMYRAKSEGRNTVCFFDPVMEKKILDRMRLEKDLQEAISGNQLELHYQPQVDSAGHIRSAEALLRWRHPERGYISPALFIPVAEESGQIRELGRWVIRTALTELKGRIGNLVDDTFFIAINISAVQLYDTGFRSAMSCDAIAAGVSPTQIMIEITESVLGTEKVDIASEMSELKAIGMKFALDDFGTGYSSLTRLKQLPIDELKIDQSFVRDIAVDADSLAIAKAVVALANSMGISVIAEGVETAAQKAILDGIGCRLFQGYYFSHPLPIEAFTEFLLHQRSKGSAA